MNTVKRSSGRADYDIGYGRPPVHSRFRPGQSGNSKGRPKGKKNLASELLEVLTMPVPIRENGTEKTMPAIAAALKVTLQKALKGDPRSLETLMRLGRELGLTTAPPSDEETDVPGLDDQDILDNYLRAMRGENSGLPGQKDEVAENVSASEGAGGSQ